jgi:tetratricopeptide (TPR) repeat protein
LEEADEAFNMVFELKPDAYLWQAGIAKFYLGDFEGAAEIFARNAATFESRFGGPASEERIWRDTCELKLLDSMDIRIRKKCRESGEISTMIRQIPPQDEDDMFSKESRKGIRITRDLFDASIARDHSAELLSRAKLRSLAGNYEEKPRGDLKMWKLNAWFYLGLHHDATGDFEESKKCMKMALRLCPSSGKANDIIHTLPLLHMSRRDWFDEDEFEGDPMAGKSEVGDKKPEFSPSPSEFQKKSTISFADPLIEASIQEGIGKLKMADLQDALSLRGLKTTGSKEGLQERLFYSLMDDAGFDSAFAL